MTYEQFKYRLDFFTYPLTCAAMPVIDYALVMAHPILWALAFFAGLLLWTFAEYWIHRSVLHGVYWMGIHERHHKHPREEVNFPIWQIPAYFLVIFGMLWLAFGAYCFAAFAGVVLGYIAFFTLHHLMHRMEQAAWLSRGSHEWLQDFAIRHNAHHKLTDQNYGITTDLWDRIFGTLRR